MPTAFAQFSANASKGNITLTSDKPFFRATHKGAIFRLFQTQENVTVEISAENNYSDPIRITAVKSSLRKPS